MRKRQKLSAVLALILTVALLLPQISSPAYALDMGADIVGYAYDEYYWPNEDDPTSKDELPSDCEPTETYLSKEYPTEDDPTEDYPSDDYPSERYPTKDYPTEDEPELINIVPAVDAPIVPARVNAPGTPEHGAIIWRFNNSLDGAVPVGRGAFGLINPGDDASVTFVPDRHGNADSAVQLNAAAAAGNTGLYLGTGIIDTDNYTVAFWVRPQRTASPWDGATMNNNNASMFYGAAAANRWVTIQASSQLGGVNAGRFGLWGGSGGGGWSDHFSNTQLTANEWQHVAITVAGNAVTLYRNGVQLGMVGSPGTPYSIANRFIDANAHFFLGIGHYPANMHFFRGAFDDLHVFNRTLTPIEVMQMYDPTYVPTPPEGNFTLHHWTFDGDLTGTYINATAIGDRIGADGGNITFAPGRIGQAAVLDGNSGIHLGHEVITSPSYTVSMWINPSELTPATPAFFGAAEGDRFISMVPLAPWTARPVVWHNNWGRPWWHIYGPAQMLPLNEWSHIALTVFGAAAPQANTTARFYVNGVFGGQVTDFPNMFQGARDADFVLGVAFGYDAPFRGMIDDVRIYDNARLTTAGIAALAAGAEPSIFDIIPNIVRLPFEIPNPGDFPGRLAPSIPARNTDGVHVWNFADGSWGGAIPIAPTTGSQAANFDDIILDRPENVAAASGLTLVPDKDGNLNAVRLDGNVGLYLGAGLVNTQNYTISMWVRPELTDAPYFPGAMPAPLPNSNAPIFAGGIAQNQHVMMHAASTYGGAAGSSNFGFRMTTPDRNYFANTGLVANVWQHVAVVVSSGRVSMYIDGRPRANVQSGTRLENRFEQGLGHFFLGINHVPGHANFVGAISDLMIFDGALSADTIYDMAAIVVDPSRYIIPGANMNFNDPPNPVFRDVTVHDPSMTRARVNRPDGEWIYIIGTFLQSARTQDFMYFEQLNYGAYPQLHNATDLLFFPVDNPDPSVQTFYQQIRSVRRNATDPIGAVDNGNLILWAPDIIEMPCGRFFMYYCFSHWGVPDSAIGLAIAESMDGPWVTQGLIIRSRWANNNRAMDGSPFIRNHHPNAIDPYAFFCSQGDFWMVYGSWEGGVFLVELDPDTGQLLEDSDINSEMNGYGRILVASNSNQIEGAHMIFSETSGYYYLFASWGSLASYNGYNVRMFRSRRPYGPFEDARFRQLDVKQNATSGQGRVDITGEIFHHTNDSGVKIIGGYRFVGTAIEDSLGIGYLSPGHGSMNYCPISGRYYKMFHTRFIGRGEGHQVRVHEMFMNERGWFTMAPLRFDGGEGARRFTRASLVGDYKIVNHGRGTNTTAHMSTVYRFQASSDITNAFGAVVGSWGLRNSHIADITLYGITYNGRFLRQFCDDTRSWVNTFTVISYDESMPGPEDVTTFRGGSTAGIALWGVGVSAGVPFEYDGVLDGDCACDIHNCKCGGDCEAENCACEPSDEPTDEPIFGLHAFNNGVINNQSLANGGTIRIWTRLDGTNALVPFAGLNVTAAFPNGENAMHLVNINRLWNNQNYVNFIDVNMHAPWQRIYLTATLHGQVVELTLVNPRFFSLQAFNNGTINNQSLANSGVIRIWTQLMGVNALVPNSLVVTAVDQDNNNAMHLVRVNEPWANPGFVNLIDVNFNAPWQRIYFTATVFGQTVELVLINPRPPVVPEFSLNVFNNGMINNQSLANAGLIRLWTRLDGVNANVLITEITAVDQDGNDAMVHLRRINTVGVSPQNGFDVNFNAPWQRIYLTVTAYGQTLELTLVNPINN